MSICEAKFGSELVIGTEYWLDNRKEIAGILVERSEEPCGSPSLKFKRTEGPLYYKEVNGLIIFGEFIGGRHYFEK